MIHTDALAYEDFMMQNNKKGIFYGVSVGPGDPELVTRKAWRAVQNAKIIAYPAPLNKDGKAPIYGDSFSRAIVAEAISKQVIEIPIYVPMVKNREPAQEIYDHAAKEISAYLDTGQDVYMLCEGDALTYGSFIYVLARLRAFYKVEIIAGVSSIQACASLTQHNLATRNDRITILPAPLDDQCLKNTIMHTESIAIIKLGRHLPRIKALIKGMGLMEQAIYIERASLDNERGLPLKDAPNDAPYFSMILLYKGDDPWR